MKQSHLYSFAFATLVGLSLVAQTTVNQTKSYTYESVENDPFGLRTYTLDNGLKIYISENHAQPRVQTNIAVRTGSKQDPADATGLAHYLEHMLFKGTSNLASLNWDEEKKHLEIISNLYEELRATKGEDGRKAIYHRIDSVSQIAATFVAANEYDKLISSLGAQGTNAYTSNERTVYINDIPSSELEKWMAIESERFSELVLRLFHTELEAVYEEFNRGQDSDGRQAYYKLLELLFPTHPYGQQTTIGTSEHLKNPSMVKIHDYFKRRYVPNNMAIILAGDIDPDATVAMIDKYFGKFKMQPLESMKMPVEKPLTEPVVADVFGSEAEFEMIAFRLKGANTDDALYAELLSGVLSNGTAGLIDLNLVQSQKLLKAEAYSNADEDYGYLMLSGNARNGQSLEEVRNLLLAQIEQVKEGKFDDWMINAVVRKYKKDLMQQMEANWIRAYLMSDAFILGTKWSDIVTRYDRMQKITKEQLIAWTKANFNNNYVAVNKRTGDKNVSKVDKPEITQVPINREQNSAFFTKVNNMSSARLTPTYTDFSSEIKQAQVSGTVPFRYVQNSTNELFYMYYVFDMGKNNNILLPLAMNYLPYLGTESMSPADVQKELFKLGLSFEVTARDDQSYVTVSGLKETFKEGVKFFETLLNTVVADKESYLAMVDGILKERSDAKLSKGRILFSGMSNYATYGEKNPFNTVLPETDLKSINPTELTGLLRNLCDYEHRILFYGPQNLAEAAMVLNEYHQVPAKLLPIPVSQSYVQQPTETNKVFFANYDMVQTELMMMHRGPKLDVNLMADQKIFSEYFGSGLSSIVFQEIRESRALAYSAYAGFTVPNKLDEHHYIRGYLGTQANKLGDATNALLELMSTLPRAEQQFQQSKIGALKTIESSRTYGQNILWAYEAAEKKGLDYDLNKKIYPEIEKMTFDNLQQFFDAQIKDKKYTYLVIGKKADMDMESLKKLGPVQELTLEEIFGY